VTEDGFYYDFARAEPFSTEDFEKIEKRMREIVDADLPIIRKVWEKDAAIAHFKSLGEIYKAETIDEVIKPGEPITIYSHGDKWGDLCRGPHLPSTGKLGKAFKLMKLAGAYWRGDQNNQQCCSASTARRGLTRSNSKPPASPRRSREARSPQTGPPNGSLPHAGRGQGHGVLAREGPDAVADGRSLHAPSLGSGGLCRSAHAASAGPGVLGKVRPLGEVSPEHVRLRDGGR
jgi:hypothetical protein